MFIEMEIETTLGPLKVTHANEPQRMVLLY